MERQLFHEQVDRLKAFFGHETAFYGFSFWISAVRMKSSQDWQRALRDFRHQVCRQVYRQVYQWQMGQG